MKCLLLILMMTLPAYANADPVGLMPPHREAPRLLDRTNLTITSVFGTACLLTASRQGTDKFARHLEDSDFDAFFKAGDSFGEGDNMIMTALGFYGLGRIFGQERMITTGQDLSKSLLATWGVTWALKIAVNAERPNGHHYSFPSGHTSTAFTAAPIIHDHYGRIAGIAAYTLATCTALARIENHKHHPVDVLAGAAIGIISGRTVPSRVSLKILPTPEGPAMGFGYRF